MSVILDSLDITGLIKADSFPTGINGVIETASSGSVIVYEREIKYFQIDLMGGADWGWLELSMIKNLQNLAKTIGSTYALDYEGVLFNVRFRTEEPPVVYGEKIINRSNQSNTDWYNNIAIKLMEI